jgi:molybdopterin/thiamine biosynthesis adenylyltransferase
VKREISASICCTLFCAAESVMPPVDEPSAGLDERESEVYDRQIRLWGVQVQKRMSSSKILYSGFKGVCAETAKNLVLAGINATLQDSGSVTWADLGANFFLTAADVGNNRAAACQQRVQALNGLAAVQCEERSIDELDEEFFAQFTCICLSGATLQQQYRLDALARKNGTFLYIIETFGECM